MFNNMLPPVNFSEHQSKIENYFFDTIDVNVRYYKQVLDSFDKCSGYAFNTYTSRTKNFIDYNVKNAKEVIRTGHLEHPSNGKDKV
jgi:hypothetical protein